MSKITTLFIDFDGTLVDSKISEREGIFELARSVNISEDKLENLLKEYTKENLRLWTLFENKEITIPEIINTRFVQLKSLYPEFKTLTPEKMNDIYLRNFIKYTSIDTTNLTYLKELKDKYNIIIVSNGINDVQIKRIDNIKIWDYIDSLVTSEEANNKPKPAPDMFNLSIEKLEKKIGYTPSPTEIVMVGDNYNADIVGANNFGIKSYYITDKPRENTINIKNFKEFAEIFLSSNKEFSNKSSI